MRKDKRKTHVRWRNGGAVSLIRELRKRFPKALVVGHHDLNPHKECPCYPCVEEYREL